MEASIRAALQRRLPAALGALAVLGVFGAVLLGDTFYYSDYTLIYHPLVRWSTERLAAGDAPWWNPDVGLGLPQAANPILGTFYPPLWLLIALPFTWGLNALIVAHVGLALWGTDRLLRALGADRWAALLGAASFALSGALVSCTSYVFPLLSWAWVPLVLLGAVRKQVALTGLALAASVLAGSPLAAATGVLLALCLRPGHARTTALAAALATGLAAVQILPTLAFLPDSVRADGADAAAGVWSLHPSRLAGFVLADFWGRWAPELSFWGQGLTDGRNDGNFFFYSTYVGAAPLALAPLAFADTERRGLVIGLTAALGVSLLLAMGRHTPLHGLMVEWIPGFGFFRYPEKWALPATLALSVLGGLGLTRLAAAEAPPRRWRGLALGVAGLLALGALGVLLAGGALVEHIRQAAPVPIEDAARAVQVSGALRTLGVAIAAGVAIALGPGRRWVPAALAVIALLDVASHARTLVWPGPAELYEAPGEMMGRLEDAGRIGRHPGLDRVRLHKDLDGLAAIYRRHGATLRANAVLEAGGQRVGAESPARLAHPVPPEEWLWADPGEASRILGARYLLLPPDAMGPTVEAALASGALVPEVLVAELGVGIASPALPVLPDVFCVDAATPAKASGVAGTLRRVEPTLRAVIEPETSEQWRGPEDSDDRGLLLSRLGMQTEARGAWACADFERDGPDFLIEVTTDRPALVVVRDAFAAGWEAGDYPIVRAYGSLKAIPVDAGEHRIELRYSPPGLLGGAAVTLLTLLGLVLALRRRRGAPLDSLPPLELNLSDANPQSDWSREEIYGGDGR